MSIWILGSFVLRWILQSTVGGTSIYGPLAAPIAVLMWLYMTAIAVLIGAALNAVVDRLWPHKARVVELAEQKEAEEDEVEPVMKAEPERHHHEHPVTPLTVEERPETAIARKVEGLSEHRPRVVEAPAASDAPAVPAAPAASAGPPAAAASDAPAVPAAPAASDAAVCAVLAYLVSDGVPGADGRSRRTLRTRRIANLPRSENPVRKVRATTYADGIATSGPRSGPQDWKGGTAMSFHRAHRADVSHTVRPLS